VSRRTANTKLTKLYWPSRKRSPNTCNWIAKKVEVHTTKNVCAPPAFKFVQRHWLKFKSRPTLRAKTWKENMCCAVSLEFWDDLQIFVGCTSNVRTIWRLRWTWPTWEEAMTVVTVASQISTDSWPHNTRTCLSTVSQPTHYSVEEHSAYRPLIPDLGVNYPNLVMGPFDLRNGLFFILVF